ncbi:MAG: hypothetical protein DRI81_09480 [Chloroflexi bacterium]|nr:MAG: hypothetical protein DRI81_09480 [Chloroflexota bacterium]
MGRICERVVLVVVLVVVLKVGAIPPRKVVLRATRSSLRRGLWIKVLWVIAAIWPLRTAQGAER